MKYIIFAALIMMSLIACSSDDKNENSETSLTIINENEHINIYSVQMVGYDFSSLSIDQGDSQTFVLNQGMPAGFDGINVNINWSCGYQGWSGSIEVDFTEGQNLTLLLSECSEQGGGTCRGEVCIN